MPVVTDSLATLLQPSLSYPKLSIRIKLKVKTLMKNSKSHLIIIAIIGALFLAGPANAQIQDDSLLGVGINVFNYSYPRPPALAKVINTPSGTYDVRESGLTNREDVYGSNFSEFVEKTAVSVGLEGSYAGFSNSMNTTVGNIDKNSLETKFLKIKNTISGRIVVFNYRDAGSLRKHLNPEFKKAVNRLPPLELFATYGTHVMTEIGLGGEAEVVFNSSASKSESKNTFVLNAKAAYKGLGGSVSGAVGIDNSSQGTNRSNINNNSLRVHGGDDSARQRLASQQTPANWTNWAGTVRAHPAFLGPTKGGLIPIWELIEDEKKAQEVKGAFLRETAKNVAVTVFSQTSATAATRPDAKVTIPEGYKLLSGGAIIDQAGAGNLLTYSFPESNNSWRGIGKDHSVGNAAKITVYALAISDPHDIWDTKQFCSKRSKIAAHPVGSAEVGAGYVMTGGGAWVDWNGAGNLLTASYPKTKNIWEARSKDHSVSDPASILVCAIGLKSKIGVRLTTDRNESSSSSASHPSATVSPNGGFVMVGGGAFVDWAGAGNLLTASYPVGQNTWGARSKDHSVSSPAKVLVYTLGISVDTSSIK